VVRRWRLRNKLLLGLGLMLACVAALFAGTAYGLSSYMGAMKTTDSKLNELLTLDQLMGYLRKKKLAREDQKLAELSSKKLLDISKHLSTWIPEIRGK